VVIAAATIEECLHFVIMARKLAETFRTPVILLTDAKLGTGVQPYPRPDVKAEWFASPIDQSIWKKGVPPYDWNKETGLSQRPIVGQPGGEFVLTGLAHTKESKVAYDRESNQRGCNMRSRKLAALSSTLKPPEIHGDPEGDLLVVGWGSTLGAIEEAVDKVRADGLKVSSLHLRFISPLEPGLKEIFSRFKNVLTVEINYSDEADAPLINQGNRRYTQLAMILRAQTLVDVDCWSNVHGQPMQPGLIYEELSRRIKAMKGEN
jgi:2-oxoglutarate ferredoxin oxidoreductase subunit alpha